ncbi:MAG: serine kinase [Mesorhizobium amorphae]|nr:MAG: serine kinase [Mesorhizobium amorphae]
MSARNIHASAVLLRGHGVVILGPSGSGKTRLALRLAAEAGGLLVADDQLLLRSAEDALWADAPPAIAGLVEVRGFGPVSVPFAPSCPVSLAVRLVEPETAPRMREEGAVEMLDGHVVPRLDLARHDAEGAVLAVKAWLFGTPF